MYRGYQLKLLDYYEVAAFAAANIMSAAGGKKVKPAKLFNRRRAEKMLFRQERNTDSMRERYERAKRIAEQLEVVRNGGGGKRQC